MENEEKIKLIEEFQKEYRRYVRNRDQLIKYYEETKKRDKNEQE